MKKIHKPKPYQITIPRLYKLFRETPETTESAITSTQIGKNKITLTLNRYFIRPIETKKLWNKYRYRLHSYNLDPLSSKSTLEFKRCI